MLCIPITLKSALHTASLKPILCIHSLIFQFRCHIRCDICGFTFIILIIFLYTTSLLSLLPNIISINSHAISLLKTLIILSSTLPLAICALMARFCNIAILNVHFLLSVII